jgi:AAA+ ATPase superfamily predicted ATPase
MENPFVYNAIVTGDYFCGRSKYIQNIVSKIDNSVNVLLFSKRRYGKTSLLKEIFESYLPKNVMKIYIDLFSITDETDFAKQVSIGIANSDFKKDTATRLKELGGILKNIRLSVSPDPSGGISLTPTFDSGSFDFVAWFESTFDNLNNFLKKNNMKGCIIFDEFQQINTVKEHDLESLLRGKVQQHNQLSYIFTGSKQHILANMFIDTNRPLYTLADIIELMPIDKQEFYKFATERFSKKSKTISEADFKLIYELAFGETRFIQKLCHYLFENESTIINEDLILSVLKDITSNNDNFFRNYFPNSFTAAQRKALLILSQHSGNLFSREITSKYDISTATLQRALKTLEEKLAIYKDGDQYKIYDVEFYHWLRTINT